MSANWRRTKHYRQPSKKEVSKILFLQYELEELFNDGEIIDLMATARQSVAGEFYFAREENPRWRPGSDKKRFRGTDNFIIGVGGRPSDLAQFVANKTHRQIISARQLPHHLASLSPKLIEKSLHLLVTMSYCGRSTP